jgi:hypothetical protein
MKGIILSEIASYNNGVKRTILKTFSGLGDQMYRRWSNQGDKVRIYNMRRAPNTLSITPISSVSFIDSLPADKRALPHVYLPNSLTKGLSYQMQQTELSRMRRLP